MVFVPVRDHSSEFKVLTVCSSLEQAKKVCQGDYGRLTGSITELEWYSAFHEQEESWTADMTDPVPSCASKGFTVDTGVYDIYIVPYLEG
jgi:hypothetical protein